jgi:predicted TPR repeat methyltransferase
MLNLARKKNTYDVLKCVDIEEFLSFEHQIFDLIYASSVIQFFDDAKLNTLLSLLQKRLSTDGVFMFTFDVCENGIKLNSKLFMEHSLKYIEITAKKYFIDVDVEEIVFGRKEQGKLVKCGLAIISHTRV